MNTEANLGSQAIGIDLPAERRPGTWRLHDPRPWPNARFSPARQPGTPAAPKHGRPGKRMPPVFGTATPPRGLAGVVRRKAYRYPDHVVKHWLLLLLADRVDSWTLRAKRALPVILPLAGVALLTSRRRTASERG